MRGRDPRPKAIGAHVYSGAFTLGVSRKFNVVGQWEEGPWGARTFELNFPDVPHPLSHDAWPVAEHKDKVQFLFANAPCAPWSVVGGKLGTHDPRLAFTRNVVDLALELSPEVFILESVPRAWSISNGGREYYTGLARELGGADYQVTVYLTNGLLVGGPQWRERFHFIAHRHELSVPKPSVTIGDVPTVRDLIGDIEQLAVYKDEDTPVIPNHSVKRPSRRDLNVIERLAQGERWIAAADRARAQGFDAPRGRLISIRLRYDTTCSTMADISATIHPTASRLLTLREGARLCGYPDDFLFALEDRRSAAHDARSSDVTQAVLPQVGEHLAGLALRSLDGGPAQSGELNVIDHRSLARSWSSTRYARELNKGEVGCIKT